MIEKLIPEYAQARKEKCLSCEAYNIEKNKCGKCGCYIPAKILLKPTKCPLGKWDK